MTSTARLLSLHLVKAAGLALLALVSIWAALALANYLPRLNDTVALPNGLVIRRELDFGTLRERSDLFAPDGRRLVRSIDLLCFNDGYVRALSQVRSQDGLFDAAGRRVSERPEAEQRAIEGELLSGSHSCNGYYTGWVGAGLLYGEPWPFQPPCAWRNSGNPALRDQAWIDRPCDPDPAPWDR